MTYRIIKLFYAQIFFNSYHELQISITLWNLIDKFALNGYHQPTKKSGFEPGKLLGILRKGALVCKINIITIVKSLRLASRFAALCSSRLHYKYGKGSVEQSWNYLLPTPSA